jgi:uncharacterized protein YcfJ
MLYDGKVKLKGIVMKNINKVGIVAGLVALGITGSASAQQPNTAYPDAIVYDNYKIVSKKIPHTEQVCETTKVPIYGEDKMDTDGAILGGIIGGVIGNQIGKGTGKQAATGVGALIGAIQGGKGDKKIVGYQNVQQCYNNTTYTHKTENVYKNSTVEFEFEGKIYRLNFKK